MDNNNSLSTDTAQAPTIERALDNINTGLVARGEFVEALRQLMLLAPDHLGNAQLWLMVGLVYTRIAHWKPAIEALETALQLNPKDNQAKQLLSLALFSVGQKERACQLIDQVCKHKEANSAQWMLRAYLHAHTSSDPMHALHVARDWGKRFADPLTRNAKPLKVQDRNPRKKLKIGYVTADFRQHSVAFFMQPVLAHHNPDSVEVHVYFNGYADDITAQMRALVPHWRDVLGMSDEALCETIRQDGIDVLVDLSGFTHGHRLLTFARRAAPVQVTWLGYMQTLGMKAMDYRLEGLNAQSLHQESQYAETLFYLRGMACYTPPAYAPLCEEPPMLRNGYPTLVSLNNSAKITDEMLHIWAQILHARDDARLIIMVKEDSPEAAQAHMQPRVEAAGMPLERVSVLHQQPLNQFMEMGHIADIVLDTSPISGGTTTLHALWMGMLLVTLDAERAVDASTARTLRGLGFGGEVAKDAQGYVDAALLLMNSPERLQKRRQVQRMAMQRSGLMNYVKRVEGIERAYRLMWLNYLRGNRKIMSVDADMESLLAEVEMDGLV